VAFVVAAAGVPWLAPELAGHYYQPRVLALVHVLTLGWITLAIMGASAPLIPVLLERPLWSARIARWQLPVLGAGIVGVVGHFFIGEWSGLLWSAGLVALAIAAFVTNVAMSLRGLSRWTFTAVMIAFAAGGIALTALAGLALGVDHVAAVLPLPLLPRLHAHVHLALLGWVLPMVLGVAARAYPMFLLAREPGRALVAVQGAGLAAGVPLVVVGLLVHPLVTAVGALGVAAAIAGHLASVVDMVRTRRRPALDWGLRLVLAGAVVLALATLLGLGFATGLARGPRLAFAYAALALGWASLTIAGMMLKIVAFFVWYRVYAPQAGRTPVPTTAQLSAPAVERLAWVLLTGGVLGLAAALAAGDPMAIRVAGVLVAAGALAFAGALARVLRHLAPRGTGASAAPARVVSP
jgi:hypothetical protein